MKDIQLQQGQLFGSPLFLYEAENTYILVWLKFKEKSLSYFDDSFNQSLKDLLCYRHKILFTTQQSKDYYREAQILGSQLEKKIPKFGEIEQETDDNERLKGLKTLLKESVSWDLSIAKPCACSGSATTRQTPISRIFRWH